MSQFRIEEKITESGSTTVYRAFQEALARPVLLKVLHQHLANDPVVRERFSREAKACAHLRSEHIVQVYDLTEYNGCPAIVMEYVHGQSLKDVVATTDANRDDLATKTAVSILQALSVAHRRGVVHRDIKPGNILLADDGVVKLTDFGLAHVAHQPTVTIEGTVLGTPAYMAPEQIRGEKVDARADFFSLGATLVEILTGERIFEGSTYSECVRKIMEFRADTLDRLKKAVPAERLVFLKRLMDPDPDRRYQSAKEALRDLGEREEDDPLEASASQPSRRILIGASSVVGIAAILGLLYLAVPKPQQADSGGEMLQPQRTTDSVGAVGEKLRSIGSPAETEGKKAVPKDEASYKSAASSSVKAVVPARDSAKIIFTSNPWAKVYVDGRLVGETPLPKPLYLIQGKHSVTFTNPSFDPIVRNIDVQPRRDQLISADFLEHAGYLVCTVQPWADIYVDEQYKDTTPLNKPIILSAGVHRLRFHNGALRDSMRMVTIKPRDTLAISITLKSLK